ncbi:MAG TPA: helix-hairpin-helix domain-containing protein [Nakamurella sp.]
MPRSTEGRARFGARLVRHGPWGALAERWVPEPLRTARVGPGRRGVVIICLVALVAAAVAGLLAWRDRPQPRAVSATVPKAASVVTTVGSDDLGGASLIAATPDPSRAAAATHGRSAVGGSATAGSAPPVTTSVASGTSTATRVGTPASSTTSAAAPSVIVVSVTGLVKHPGLVRLSAGARVADAIAAAGGVVGAGDLTGMNLAARMTDGASVVVGTSGSGSVTAPEAVPTIGVPAGGGSNGAGAATDAAAGPVESGGAPVSTAVAAVIDLNTADAAALDALPGVGPVTAAAIVAYREQHGPFASVDQLQAISGIGPARFAQIAPHVKVGGAPP